MKGICENIVHVNPKSKAVEFSATGKPFVCRTALAAHESSPPSDDLVQSTLLSMYEAVMSHKVILPALFDLLVANNNTLLLFVCSFSLNESKIDMYMVGVPGPPPSTCFGSIVPSIMEA